MNLTDGDVSPVAEVLIGRGVPVLLQTGVGLPPALAARFPGLLVNIKPCAAADVVTQLAALIGECQRAAFDADNLAAP